MFGGWAGGVGTTDIVCGRVCGLGYGGGSRYMQWRSAWLQYEQVGVVLSHSMLRSRQPLQSYILDEKASFSTQSGIAGASDMGEGGGASMVMKVCLMNIRVMKVCLMKMRL